MQGAHSAFVCKWCAGINLLVFVRSVQLELLCRAVGRLAPGDYSPIVIGLPEMGFKLELIWASCCSSSSSSYLLAAKKPDDATNFEKFISRSSQVLHVSLFQLIHVQSFSHEG